MAFVLNYTAQTYQNKINAITDLLERLSSHLATMKDLRSQVYNFWDDDLAREACQDLDIMIRQVENTQERTLDLLNLYRGIVDDMSNASIFNTGALKDAGDLLSSLGI